ncbi:prephenate dehydrogenase [Actinomyces minihominis]|uniref:prephenate dehydrogenase n=1 Tax=Actinomyces minihominis TaxID=2002838 RepID=UPI000C086323|nr:prephenate dehydrogenase [Actinomyces minihominis]
MALIQRAETATKGPVLVIGTGLIGTSIALALRSHGVPVYLWDPSPTSLALAGDMGAGIPLRGDFSTFAAHAGPGQPLVVIAAPPDVSGGLAATCLRLFRSAIVTDVASVKEAVVGDLLMALEGDDGTEGELTTSDLERYVGSHPMAGRARSGASHADGDLFVGRPWVIVPTDFSAPATVTTVRSLAVDVGAVPSELGPVEHDDAVALVSHVPQLVSSLLASRLNAAPLDALGLAGQGLRDMTRIAASDPGLWTAIISGNSRRVADVLGELRDDLEDLINGLEGPGLEVDGAIAPGVAGAIARVMTSGNRGAERIPGKHGDSPRRWGYVEVLVPDSAGELGRLFSDLGAIGVNVEDLVLEHSAGQPVGLARLMIKPSVIEETQVELEQRGWRVASSGLG